MKKRVRKFNWKIFVVSFIIVFAISFIASLFTGGNTNGSWYLQNKPSFTPPNFVFPIAWTILYFLIGLSLYFVWNGSEGDKKARRTVAVIFGLNLFFNLIWSPLFFSLKLPVISFIDILLMISSAVAMIAVSWKIDRKASYMLMPYLAWICFASVLNLGFFV